MMGGTKTFKFYDLWIFGPLGPFIYGFEYTKLIQNRRQMDTFLNALFSQLSNSRFLFLKILDQMLETMGTKNEEDPFQKFL